MPRSCKCILDTMVHKGAMTKEERDKILRNMKGDIVVQKLTDRILDIIEDTQKWDDSNYTRGYKDGLAMALQVINGGKKDED